MISDRKIRHIDFDQLPRRVIRHGVELEILAPSRHFRKKNKNGAGRDLNNNSLVLRVSQGRVSFLFTGDIMAPAESELVARIGSQLLKSTILMVPHHGSRTSSSKVFINAVTPVEAVISAGWQNRFNFPHEEVIQRLKFEGCRIWCTAESGAVEVTTDGKSYSINTFRLKVP